MQCVICFTLTCILFEIGIANLIMQSVYSQVGSTFVVAVVIIRMSKSFSFLLHVFVDWMLNYKQNFLVKRASVRHG